MDNAITGVVSASLSSGDVVRKTVAIAPAGFLRCNGGCVSKTTYAGLFAVVGEKYSHYTFPGVTVGSGKPWVQQYEFNDSLNLNITEWLTGPSLPVPLINSQVVVTKSQVYLLGGVTNGNNYLSTVHTAPINLDGTIGAWTTSTSLPFTIGLSQAIVTKNRIYLIGGTINGNNSSAVYTAPINLDGTIGTWATSTSLPITFSSSQAILTKNRVYLLGGYQNSFSSLVFSAIINGGLNDYCEIYSGLFTSTDSNDFSLPDFTPQEVDEGVNYFIKT